MVLPALATPAYMPRPLNECIPIYICTYSSHRSPFFYEDEREGAIMTKSTPRTLDGADYAPQVTPLSCEREPIHIVNRIQPCGTLLVVDTELKIVQCSTNAVGMLPEDYELGNLSNLSLSPDEDDDDLKERRRLELLDAIVGSPLSLLLHPEAVDKVRAIVRGATSSTKADNPNGEPPKVEGRSGTNTNAGAVRTFLVRTQRALSIGRSSCGVTQSGEHFLLEIEDQETPPVAEEEGSGDAEGEEDTMIFMQSIAHELRKCWSIEEMAGLVCSRIMSETPYDRGMVSALSTVTFVPGDFGRECNKCPISLFSRQELNWCCLCTPASGSARYPSLP